jgi:hypothetical protein
MAKGHPLRTSAKTGAAAKRTALRLGRARVAASYMKGLRAAWKQRQLVLFLGAGVSVPYGLPSWRNLVLELLFEQAQRTRRLGPLWPHYRRAVASWMADYFDYDPLVLARVVERDLRSRRARRTGGRNRDNPTQFLERLRAHLYVNVRVPRSRTPLQAVAELLAQTTAQAGVEAVVSFNFDDLLEQELQRRRIPFTSVSGPRRPSGTGVRVIHAHGYVPRAGPISRQDVVFTEPDYHRLIESVFHWGLAEIVERLRKSTVLFLGLSMSDPSLRRLLDASRNTTIPPHCQIQKRHEVRKAEMPAAMAEIERRARAYAQVIGAGFDDTKRPAELADAVRAALRQADTYDREVFESMGVSTIWVDSFDDIPAIIDAIPASSRRR